MKSVRNAISSALIVLALLVLAAGPASANLNIVVTPSSAPNASGSPSWPGYVTNALNSLENNLGNIGDRSTNPAAYEIAGSKILPGEIAVTSFHSWRGQLTLPVAFANEHGNRLHFGLHIIGDGTQFRLNELTYAMHSSDTTDSLVYVGSFAGSTYAAHRTGIDWGLDRIRGTADDVVVRSGPATTLVDELVYVGVGNAWWPSPESGQTNADAMQDYYDWVNSEEPIRVTTTYSMYNTSGTLLGSGSASVDVVPVPAAAVLGMIGLGLVGVWQKRKVRG